MNIKLIIFLFFIVCIEHSNAQYIRDDGYRDDEGYKKLVYSNIQNEMNGHHVKGSTELKFANLDLVDAKPFHFNHHLLSSQTNVLSGSQLYSLIKKSVFSVWKFYKKTKTNIQGVAISATAFAIGDDGTMVTNFHVLANILDSNEKIYEMDSCVFLSDYNGNVYSIDKILGYNKSADIAIFKVNNRTKTSIVPLRFSAKSEIGENIWLLSNPFGYPYYFSSGIIARKQLYSNYGEGAQRIDITADYGVGSSGGPIVNSKGELVSIVCTTFTLNGNKNTDPQMVIKETIPVDLLRKMFN